MAQLLMTGFPGFLGSALLPRLLARRPDAEAVCLVQSQHAVPAGTRVRELAVTDPHTAGRVRLVEGDVTAAGLGLSPAERRRLDDVQEVWHLAALLHLAVPTPVARRVNVGGTVNVLAFCREQPNLRRLQYVSTCYVSGRHDGAFAEDSLEVGQDFRNHYEETKYEAELLVRRAMTDGLPATVYRPGIVVGDSAAGGPGASGATDGPYVLPALLARQRSPVLLPAVGDADTLRVCLVPREFVVGAMDELSLLEESRGRTYALVDPDPPSVRQVVATIAEHRGARVVRVPVPLRPLHALGSRVPGLARLLGLPPETLDYLVSPTTYPTRNTVRDLTASGVTCPPFASYADRLLEGLYHPGRDARATS